MKNRESIINIAGIIFLHLITLFFIGLALHTKGAIGESDDYMLTTVALQNHGSIRITEADVNRATKDFPEHAWYFQSSWEKGMPALFSIKEGEVYPWYMGTYSLSCIPAKVFLEMFGLNQSYAFALTNVAFAVLALWICWRILKASPLQKLILLFMLSFSPIWWYIRWPSAEIFIFSLVVISLTFFANKQYHWAGLTISIAGTMNIAVMALGLAIIIDYIKETCQKYFVQGERNIWKIMRSEKKSIFLLVVCFLPSLITPVYNIIKFRIMNLQSILGFATGAGYVNRVTSHLFDLNIGFLAYFAISFSLFIAIVCWGIIKRRWRILIYGFAFLMMVMLYSITYHINSGMVGLPRYSTWAFPVFAFALVLENGFVRKRAVYILNGLLVISTFLTIFIVCEKKTELEPTNISMYITTKFPELYNPYYPIFISRFAGIGGGYTPYQESVPEALALGTNYEDYLPVICCDSNGSIRKILIIPELAEKLTLYIEGSSEDMEELQKKIDEIKNSKQLQYINLHSDLRIKSEYLNFRFAYTYGKTLKPAGPVPLSYFKVTDTGKITESSITLPPGAFQFGPYLPMSKGDYKIIVNGKGLEQLYVDALIDNEMPDIVLLKQSDDQIQYSLHLDKNADSIELRGQNIGDKTIEISSIQIFLQ